MKRRGLMIIHNYRPGPTGGAELQAEMLASKLVKIGHQIRVLTRRTVSDAPVEEIEKGVNIRRVDFPLAYLVTSGVEKTFQYLVKHRKSFDILHSHMVYGHAVVATVFAQAFRKKSIIKVACLGEYGDFCVFSKCNGFNWALEVLHQADAMVAISREVEQDLLHWGFEKNRIYRIPNGVDTQLFHRNKEFSHRNPVKFILVGRRHPQKGIDVALKAVRILQDSNLKIPFKISFFGAEYPEHNYQKMARELNIVNNVEFFPFKHNIMEIYQNAHCLILPSRGEGLSNALLEAMAMELPVIASRVSGTLDVVSDGVDGILVPTESPELLAKAMRLIIEKDVYAKELGKNARNKVVSNFSIETVADKYSELYNNV